MFEYCFDAMSESVLTRCLNMSDCDVWALEYIIFGYILLCLPRKLGRRCAIGAVLPTHENELYHDHNIQYRLRVQRADQNNTICMVGPLNTQQEH